HHLVSRIACTTGHFVRSILAGERGANKGRLRCLHHRENFSCRSRGRGANPARDEGGGKPHQRRGRGQAPPLLYFLHLIENVSCIFSLEIVLQSEQQHEGNIATILIKSTRVHIGHTRLESGQVAVQHCGDRIAVGYERLSTLNVSWTCVAALLLNGKRSGTTHHLVLLAVHRNDVTRSLFRTGQR